MTEPAGAPRIGVAMPARDAGRYIGQAIESILGQSLPPTEVVVVDDGSADDTAAIAESFGAPVRLLRQPATGPAAARNRAIAALSGELVALLDADDLWPPDSLARRHAALAADPAADICFGAMVQFISPELPQEEKRRLVVDDRPQPGWTSSAMLCRRSVFDRFGLLPEHRRAGDFLEWLLAARAGGARIVTIDEVVLRRRLHLSNLTRREPEANADYVAIVRAELARKRAAGG